MNLRFRRALADAEDGRDFVMLKSFDVVEDERRARPFGQPRNGTLEVEPFESAISSPLAVPASSPRPASSSQHARPRLAALQVIETPVHRQSIQPGSDRGVAAKFRELSIGQQKDFLQQILGVGPGAAHPPREVEQPRRMLPIELLESWHISFGHSPRLDDVALGGVASASQHWKIRRLLDLQNVVGLRFVDWKIRGTRPPGGGLTLTAGGSEGGCEDRSQFVRFLFQGANRRRRLESRPADDAEPQFAFVGFFSHDGEL